jgi:Peptidase A4 family
MRRVLIVVVLVVFIPVFLAPVQAGAVPLIADVYAVPSVLGPAGGTVTVLGWETSFGPATCQLRFDGTSLRRHPPPILAYSRAPRPCEDTVVARVSIGALPLIAPEALSFTVTVRNAQASMSKAFSVEMERDRLWADAGAPLQQRASRNWSGYVLTGGPYTAVTGTFQVPLVYATAGCRDTYAEWAGIDGVGNQDLLQAGISEQMSTLWGACTRHPQVWAWSEILPGPADPFVTLAVRPGQWVTVTIADIFGGWWFVGVFNDSTGARISTQGLYDGPHSSAEWVVEASSSNLCSTQSHVDRFSACDMAAFNGPARFTGLDVVGPTKEMAEVDLVQHAVQVASPSPVWSVSQLLAQGFDVTYSGLDRPAPLSLLATEPTLEHERP